MSRYHRYLSRQLLAEWQVSRACSMSTCIAVLDLDTRVLVRDSKLGDDRQQPILELSPEQWSEFVRSVASLPDEPLAGAVLVMAGGITVSLQENASVDIYQVETNIGLNFTPDEWRAFRAGVQAGEF